MKRSSGGQTVRVVKAHYHLFYSYTSRDYDIGLLKTEPMTLCQTNAQPIRLPQILSEPSGEVTVSGWGKTSDNDTTLPEHLQVVELPVISTKDCLTYFPRRITPRMFCAGYEEGGKDACNGDSGGPAASEDKKLDGIVSWGHGCGEPRHPGVYAKVSKFINWILIRTRKLPLVECT